MKETIIVEIARKKTKGGNEKRVTECEWVQVIKEGLFEEQTPAGMMGEKGVSR